MFDSTDLFTSPTDAPMNPVIGYIGVIVAVFFFGSNFIPTKLYETGDGMYFQLCVCVGIWLCGLCVSAYRYFSQGEAQPLIPAAMLGGVIWATGNLCTVPIVKCIGLARGLLCWGMVNMFVGWITSLLGVFDGQKNIPKILWLNILGVVVCLACVAVSSQLKNSDADLPTASERKSDVEVTMAYNNVGNGHEEPVKHHQVPLVENTEKGWVEKMGKQKKFAVGLGLSVFAGITYGCNFAPCNWYVTSKYNTHNWSKSEMEFSHFCGILLASVVYFVVYACYNRNSPTVYPKVTAPGFLSGLMWGIAQTGWFYANENLSETISFPIVCCGPTIISSIWGMTLYKEISGKRNVMILLVLIAMMLGGSLMVVFSK